MTIEDEDSERKAAYELQPIHVRIRLHKLDDVPILHPLRYHPQLIIRRCRTNQWQHVRMAKGLPSENLLAEPLRGTRQFVDARGSRKTYPANPFDVAR